MKELLLTLCIQFLVCNAFISVTNTEQTTRSESICEYQSESSSEILKKYTLSTLKKFYAIGNIENNDHYKLIGYGGSFGNFRYNILCEIKCNKLIQYFNKMDDNYEKSLKQCIQLYFMIKNITIHENDIGIIVYSTRYHKCNKQPGKIEYIIDKHGNTTNFHYFSPNDMIKLLNIGSNKNFIAISHLYYYLNGISPILNSASYIIENTLTVILEDSKDNPLKTAYNKFDYTNKTVDYYKEFCLGIENIENIIIYQLILNKLNPKNNSIIYNPCQNTIAKNKPIGPKYFSKNECFKDSYKVEKKLEHKIVFIYPRYDYSMCYNVMSQIIKRNYLIDFKSKQIINKQAHSKKNNIFQNRNEKYFNLIPMYTVLRKKEIRFLTKFICTRLHPKYCNLFSYISAFIETINSNAKFKKRTAKSRRMSISEILAEIFTLIRQSN